MGTRETLGEKREEITEKQIIKCESCGHKPKDKTEEKVITETKQCIVCITKREKIQGTNAKICEKCREIAYPLNTFLNTKREKWLCGSCTRKEILEAYGIWERLKQAKMP